MAVLIATSMTNEIADAAPGPDQGTVIPPSTVKAWPMT